MSLGSRINEIRKEKNISIDDLCERSGVPKGTLSKITAGITTSPTLDTVKAIARALDCRLDDFDDFPNKKNPPPFSDEAMKIAKQYDELDNYARETVAYLVEREIGHVSEIRHALGKHDMEAAGELIYFPLSLSMQPVSAGKGAYLGPEEMEAIFVQQNSLTKQASFAVKVAGDSMEPLYSDGDILLVEGADDIRIGEIGVFTMDGDGYVKKRGEGELISLNPDYAPIPMNESIWCNGRVIGKLAPEWIQ
ncbi:MAG: LexA family transcriptional regulator [Schwartzia sp.]|nr:LexA family transcriptional regulator [Schwartzia sp. (in: firmicutes)]